MPGLFGRTMTIIKSKFSHLLDRAENPTQTLDYSYEQQLQQLQNVKRGIADVATAKKRLEIQYTTMQQQVEKLDGQAKQALEANREDLAREALTRKAAIQGQLDGIMQQGQQLEAQQQKLIESEQALAAKIEPFRTQKEVIKAQYSAAEAQVRIGEAATGNLGTHMADVGLAVERAKDKTQRAAGARRRDQRADRGRGARGLHRARATTSTASSRRSGRAARSTTSSRSSRPRSARPSSRRRSNAPGTPQPEAEPSAPPAGPGRRRRPPSG